MSVSYQSQQPSWTARIAWILLFVLIGAGAAVWALGHWQSGARFFGIVPGPAPTPVQPVVVAPPATPAAALGTQQAVDASRMAALESRMSAIESKAQAAAGSAGRADALLIAFAARRAIDRGVALGYLEPLLVQRFGPQHQQAVATIVTAARQPVRLDDLVSRYEGLAKTLRGGGADESWWSAFQREMGQIVSVHRADVPSPQPQARYDRALAQLKAGQVDAALAETMRLPGAAAANSWVTEARRYIASHRALDEVESAALLGGGAATTSLPVEPSIP